MNLPGFVLQTSQEYYRRNWQDETKRLRANAFDGQALKVVLPVLVSGEPKVGDIVKLNSGLVRIGRISHGRIQAGRLYEGYTLTPRGVTYSGPLKHPLPEITANDLVLQLQRERVTYSFTPATSEMDFDIRTAGAVIETQVWSMEG